MNKLSMHFKYVWFLETKLLKVQLREEVPFKEKKTGVAVILECALAQKWKCVRENFKNKFKTDAKCQACFG